MRSKEIVPNGTADARIYLITHLTTEWKHLLWLAKQKGRPIGYKMVWFQDSKILAKKDITDPRPIFIFSEEDLSKLGQ